MYMKLLKTIHFFFAVLISHAIHLATLDRYVCVFVIVFGYLDLNMQCRSKNKTLFLSLSDLHVY